MNWAYCLDKKMHKMKKYFAAKLFLFTIFFILLSNITNAGYTTYLQSDLLVFRLDEQFDQVKQNISILILGDSHAKSSVYPQYLNGSFIAATAGETYIQTYYRLLYYLEKEKVEVQLVLLPLDLHNFASNRSVKIRFPEYWNKYINYWELGKNRRNLWFYILQWGKGQFAFLSGIDTLFNVVILHKGDTTRTVMMNGYTPQKGLFYQDKDIKGSAQDRVQRHFSNLNRIDNDTVAYFVKILELLHSHDVEVVFIRYPVTDIYYREADKMIMIDQYYSEISQIIKRTGYSFTILDYHDVYWDKPQYFYDQDHLNANGSIEFTKLLIKDLYLLDYLPLE